MARDGKGIAMDRLWATPWDDGRQDHDRDRRETFTLPSRNAAIEALRPALRTRSGPVLVTGDAGVGKTWLGRRLRTEVPPSWRWVGIDPSPANDAGEFYRLVAHALGLVEVGGLAASRLALADFLRDRAADGDSWVLAIDEAHGLADAVLEEIRVLSNRLGQPDGFAGLVLIGQTMLGRRLASHPLVSLASRITARTHVRPLDIEEASMLLDRLHPDLGWDRDTLERLQRETAGNPKQLLRLARQRSGSAPRRTPVRPAAPVVPAPPVLDIVPVETPAHKPWDGPVLGTAKPPLRVEEGLIEVGWDPDPDPEPEPAEGQGDVAAETPPRTRTDVTVPAEEPVDDHYAALQAWNEWARNQGRTATVEAVDPSRVTASPAVEVDSLESVPEDGSSSPPAGVWSEGEQKFGPYSQLFSRMRQRHDTT